MTRNPGISVGKSRWPPHDGAASHLFSLISFFPRRDRAAGVDPAFDSRGVAPAAQQEAQFTISNGRRRSHLPEPQVLPRSSQARTNALRKTAGPPFSLYPLGIDAGFGRWGPAYLRCGGPLPTSVIVYIPCFWLDANANLAIKDDLDVFVFEQNDAKHTSLFWQR